MSVSGWIGVDLDGTLAHYDGWRGMEHIGEPIQPMLDRVKLWLSKDNQVKIFTARACFAESIPFIEDWCEKHIGKKLQVTNVKDLACIELWDDRAVSVKINTGEIIKAHAKPVGPAEYIEGASYAILLKPETSRGKTAPFWAAGVYDAERKKFRLSFWGTENVFTVDQVLEAVLLELPKEGEENA